MGGCYAMGPERLRANRQLRYALPAIRALNNRASIVGHQDMEFCNPCPPTLLLPISPAAHTCDFLYPQCNQEPEPH
jgi:hypothetical protein